MKSPLLFLCFFLSACSKPASQANSSSGSSVTTLAPVSADESKAILAAIRFGSGVGPGESPNPIANCEDFVANYPDFVPGNLEVPEDWDHADTSPKVKLFYYWRNGSEAGADKRPPIVFFNGGPASDSHSSADVLADLPFTQHAALVFLDQRGTGCSSPFPAEVSVANAQRLMNWGSRAIVHDSEALRKHLFGDQKWRAFGQSYGGFIVHRYLEVAPEGLDRAIAHGSSVMTDPVSWLTERIRSQARVSATYFSRNSSDREALSKTRAQIPDTQCWTSGAYKSCGPAVLDSITIPLGFQDSWPSLHQWISRLRDKNGSVNQTVLSGLVRTYVFGVYGEGGLGGNVISKMEIAPGYNDRDGCLVVMERMRANGEKPDSFDVNECRLLTTLQSPYEEALKVVAAQPLSLNKIAENLSRGGEFYLFSGQQDVFVPFATFDEEVRRLGGHVHYESFPNSGHEGYYTEPHVIDAVMGAAARLPQDTPPVMD
jgi:pimeloyl-ACP methyl ester carboxylesterase